MKLDGSKAIGAVLVVLAGVAGWWFWPGQEDAPDEPGTGGTTVTIEQTGATGDATGASSGDNTSQAQTTSGVGDQSGNAQSDAQTAQGGNDATGQQASGATGQAGSTAGAEDQQSGATGNQQANAGGSDNTGNDDQAAQQAGASNPTDDQDQQGATDQSGSQTNNTGNDDGQVATAGQDSATSDQASDQQTGDASGQGDSDQNSTTQQAGATSGGADNAGQTADSGQSDQSTNQSLGDNGSAQQGTAQQDDGSGTTQGDGQQAGAGDDDEQITTAALQPAQPVEPNQTGDDGQEAQQTGSETTAPQTPQITVEEPTNPDQPRFDIVRVDTDGQTVIAGQARPDSKVELLLDGKVVGEVQTDSRGAFVTVIFAKLTGEAQNLVARVRDPSATDDGTEANATDETVTDDPQTGDVATANAGDGAEANEPALSEPTAPALQAQISQPQLAGSEDQTSGVVAGTSGADAQPLTSDAPQTTTADTSNLDDNLPALAPVGPQEPAELAAAGTADGTASLNGQLQAETPIARGQSNSAALSDGSAALTDATPKFSSKQATNGFLLSAPVIILPSESPDEAPLLLQAKPEGLELVQPAGAEARGVVLDKITYSDAGDVQLQGRGLVGKAIRVYGNGLIIGTTRVASDGTWGMSLPRDTGEAIRLLRMDELSEDGKVTSRIEAPFQYSRLSPKIVRDRRVVIQKGDMLWRIAEQFYGEGLRYSLIYSANSELIRDPDLIYPNQVFSIPELIDAPQ
ncbi:MAG: LysM peptidoglycan-binding domain-containing protein [Pseudomonadota bacterium]